MRRVCKYCGKEYDGDPGSSACPDCVMLRKKTTLAPRVCRTCGRTFEGGPRAWYCPDCRRTRQQEANARYRKSGAQRKLGTVDRCVICGQPYIVGSARQRYCPDCAPEQYRKAANALSAAWNAEHVTPEARREERADATAYIKCVVCGKLFRPSSAAITCSPECSETLQKQRHAAWEKANADARKEYHNKRIKAAEAAMTPEEYRAYRDRINQRAREAYARRKAKKEAPEND